MRPHDDNERPPIIFNDYMNCLMGDSNEENVAALLEPVAKTGAEYFVTDAGWYADDSTWWDDVGLWEPSQKRFPSGFNVLLDKIRSKGLIPGLWLEPEVGGVRSIVASRLPKEALFQWCGRRIVGKDTFQLDHRHLKFDYNIEVTQYTGIDGSFSAGAAHLEHQRAYLVWQMDHSMLSVHSLQSTSDQQDPALYAAIAAALPTAVVLEQSATWAYPQPGWSDELNTFTVVNSLLRRVYLSGRLDKLSPDQLRLVVEGMNVYKRIRLHLKSTHPIWPLGFPQWHDDRLALALITQDNGIYFAVWRTGGTTDKDLPVKLAEGQALTTAKMLYPTRPNTKAMCNTTSGVLSLKPPNTVCARLFHVI
ncbi:Aldolase-type TIM barrel [Penicillium coprophilum]|uniref:Aldolase-type TIM barrel n=1 Tax=Penicillium coprophilum TaxID=36646 RepID=UPI0023896A5E|nr:Aldolase-type TIM barrel [Penicillium coprophilum]KAJ5158799.1 Aldolase-type TIM barrel [Penicillium coprophilum]